MAQPLRYLAYAALIIQLLVVGFVLTQAYSARDVMGAVLLALPPVLALWALYSGPDREERKLRSQVAKARLRKELQDLGGPSA